MRGKKTSKNILTSNRQAPAPLPVVVPPKIIPKATTGVIELVVNDYTGQLAVDAKVRVKTVDFEILYGGQIEERLEGAPRLELLQLLKARKGEIWGANDIVFRLQDDGDELHFNVYDIDRHGDSDLRDDICFSLENEEVKRLINSL